jgi:glycerol-3-phosphate dehydrogenase (NAD(P)+)
MNGQAIAVAVLGAGSWGTALAMQLARSGHRVSLWGRDAQQIAALNETRRNQRYFPDIELPAGLRGEVSLQAAANSADLLLVAVPTHAFADLLGRLAPWPPNRGLAWACKGFEPGSGRFLHQVAADHLGSAAPLAVVTGPSFASEVARDMPTAVTVAGNDAGFTDRVALALHAGSFRAYTSNDMIGAELGGAVKNVLAIGTGICDGLGLGNNARAALVTRGLAEMMRLGGAMGARPETLMGLAGMGDLVLTCTGEESRNRRLGLCLGQGQTVTDALAAIGQVVEGVAAALEVRRLAKQYGVKMPISKQVHGILHLGWNPEEGVRRLLAREQKPEHTPG